MTRVADRFTNGFDAEVVRAWIADDPDQQTATSLEHILAEAEAGCNRDRRSRGPVLRSPAFGTAGLRSEIGRSEPHEPGRRHPGRRRFGRVPR